MEMEHYVNSPADEGGERQQQRGNHHSGGSKIVFLVGVSFGLLCIIQAALNVSLRLQAGGCSEKSDNISTGNITMMSAGDIDAREQLVRGRDQLVKEKQQLVQERDQLVKEKQQLVQERYQLVKEKQKLVQERDQLVKEKQKLVQERDQLVKEKQKLVEERDQLVQEKQKLVQERDQLVKEKQKLVEERDQLVKEKQKLVQERDQLVKEKQKLVEERDQLVKEKQKLVQERDQLVQEKQKLVEERDQLVKEKQKLVQERDQLVQERDQLRQDKDQLTKENEELQADKRLLTAEQGVLNRKVTELQNKIQKLVWEQNTPRCPRGWKPYMSACYRHSSVRNTWEYARQNCASQGSHLVIFNDDAEERAVISFGSAAKVWMGLRSYKDPYTNSWTWTWVDGAPLSHGNWNYQNPIDWRYQAQVCAYVDQGSWSSRTWFPGTCEEQYHWVCEKELHT